MARSIPSSAIVATWLIAHSCAIDSKETKLSKRNFYFRLALECDTGDDVGDRVTVGNTPDQPGGGK